MANDTSNQENQLVQEQHTDSMANHTPSPAAEPAQESPAKKGYARKPKKKDPRFTQYDMLSPSERECLQAAALAIGGDCTLISRTVSLPGQAKGLDKPRLFKEKRTGQEGYMLQHTLPPGAHNNFIYGAGWANGFETFDPRAAINRFHTTDSRSDDEARQWQPLDPSMLNNPLIMAGQAPMLHNRPQPRYDGPNHIHGLNRHNAILNRRSINRPDFNRPDVNRPNINRPNINGAIINGPNTIGPGAFIPQANPNTIDPRLLNINQDVAMRQPFTELPQGAANGNVFGNGHSRHPLHAFERTSSIQRAPEPPHVSNITQRGPGVSAGPKQVFDSISSQHNATAEVACKHQDVNSSSASGSKFSSLAAQAGLRRQKNKQSSYTLSPDVPVPCTSSPSFSKTNGPLPKATNVVALSSSSSASPASPTTAQFSGIVPSHVPPMANGISLINPKERIPDRFHSIFPYGVFNAVQSKCFDSVYMADANVIVSAPTGSGKTVLLELAICKLVNGHGNNNAKIVYIAPTKALCKEKAEQWHKKFGILTMPVSELTGDTSRAEMRTVREAKIIVTTPEKWDSITRSWIDHRKLLDLVELFLIDEVHILKESRGATLEAVVSRMKTYGSKVRFIALSATIPNSDDVASWLGRDHANPSSPAHREVFGEEFRPVKLQKVVHGIEAKLSDHPFDKYLNSQLWKYIEMHTQRKPILVFCMTRKSCQNSAEELAKQWSQRQPSARLWPQPRKRIAVIDASLQELVRYGVAFHHAGLEPDDRRAIHQAFEEGHLSVICCTSTLAVGVNLPCHTVLLKGTVSYQDGGQLCEYSDLEVMQMLGRAGRPQYEDSALAIILTRSCTKKRYEDLGSGQQILESTLHKNLIEHLNSEISLGTFQDAKGAKLWLEGTFLSVRLNRNPRYYGDLTDGKSTSKGPETIENQLGKICEAAIDNLRDACLVKGDTKFQHTDYGRAMSKYMVRFETMKMILGIPRGAKTQDLLGALSEASEFNEIRWQANERELFRDINRDPFIMYPIEGTLGTVAHKVSLLIQMELGRVELTNINGFERQRLRAEASRVLDMMQRLIRTVIECKGSDDDGKACWAALELARSMTAKAWEGRPMQLLQVPQLGPALMRKLVAHNIRTVSELADSDPSNIERIASRNPPFGKKMRDSLAFFPRLSLRTTVKDSKAGPEGNPIIEIDALLGFSNTRGKWKGKMPIVTFLAVTTEGISTYFCRGSLNAFDQEHNTEQIHFTWAPTSCGETLICRFACEEIVGTAVSTEVRHALSPSAFPPQLKDKPLLSTGPQRQTPTQEPTALENEVEDDDMLEILDKITHQGAPEKFENFEADIGDDDLFSLLDRKGNFKARPPQSPNAKDKRGTESFADNGCQDRDRSLFSSHADQQHADIRTKQRSGSYREPKHKIPSRVHDEEAADGAPVRLPNGRYKCGHPCSQVAGGTTARGDKCGHDCCRNGSKHPPKKNNNTGKRKQQAGGKADSGSQQMQPFTLSSPPPKRAKASADKKRMPDLAELTFSPLLSQSKPFQRTPMLDLSLCDVDEEGIIDLTCDYEVASDSDQTVLKPGNNDKMRRIAIKQKNTTHDMLDNLSDGDLIGVDIAMEEPSGGNCASMLNENSRRTGTSCASTSSKAVNDWQDQAHDEVCVERDQSVNKTPSGDQGSVCDATLQRKNGSMRRSKVDDNYSSEPFFPRLNLREDQLCDGAANDDAVVAKVLARPKTQRKLGTTSSTYISKDSIAPSQPTALVEQSFPTHSDKADEPEWVNDFDASIISEFRGLVDFI